MIHVSAIAYSQTTLEAWEIATDKEGDIVEIPRMKRWMNSASTRNRAVLIRKWKEDF
jgi:hypothetical protein